MLHGMTAESPGRFPANSPPREPWLARWSRWVARHRRAVVVLAPLVAVLVAVVAAGDNFTADFVPGGEAKLLGSGLSVAVTEIHNWLPLDTPPPPPMPTAEPSHEPENEHVSGQTNP